MEIGVKIMMNTKKMTHLVLEKHQYLQKFTLLIANSCRIGNCDKFTRGKHVFERKLEEIICVFVVTRQNSNSPSVIRDPSVSNKAEQSIHSRQLR